MIEETKIEDENYSEDEESLPLIDDRLDTEQSNNQKENEKEFQINTIKKFFSTENIDLEFDASFYSNRKLEVEQLKNIINKESNHGLTGVKNLGNSCYITTILQCLSHSLELVYYFLSKLYLNELTNSTNPNLFKRGLKPGMISNLIYKVIQGMWVNSDKFIVPSDLKFLIANTNPQFNNTNQQDAHELLMYLMDLLHEDLNQATIYPGTLKFNEECIPKTQNESDISASKRFWNYYKERHNSIIVDLFHGQLKNTITCMVCDTKSVTFDPFFTLPLAIPNLKKVEVIIVPTINIRSSIKLPIYVSDTALFFDIDQYLKKYLTADFKVEKNTFRTLLVNGKTHTAKFVKNTDNIFNTSKKGFLFVYEIDDRMLESEDYYPFITLVKEGEVNFSFPRLFPIAPYANVKELRQNIYGYMRRYYPLSQKMSEKYDKLVSNYLECKYLDTTEYENVIKEEYNFLFGMKTNETEDKELLTLREDYLLNLPYKVSLVSTKDESKSKLFLSNKPEEFNAIMNENSKIEKLIDVIKTGYKLVIEIKSDTSDNENPDRILSKYMNNIVSIKNTNPEEEFTRTPTIYDCLDHFSLTEKLDKGSEYYCANCRKNQSAFRHVEIFYLPKYFIIYLNRFESKFLGKFKIQILKDNRFVKYPLNGLNLLDYCAGTKEPRPIYELYAASQHSGSVEGGHYATACRNFGKWYLFDDVSLFPSDEDIVVSPEGYVLFFRRQK